jgi:hypothetical protein
MRAKRHQNQTHLLAMANPDMTESPDGLAGSDLKRGNGRE